jgi:hypothetical protein
VHLALDFRGRGVVWRLRAPLPDSQSCALCPLFVLTPAVAAMAVAAAAAAAAAAAVAAEQALHRGSFPFPAVREMIESPCLGSCAHGDSIPQRPMVPAQAHWPVQPPQMSEGASGIDHQPPPPPASSQTMSLVRACCPTED